MKKLLLIGLVITHFAGYSQGIDENTFDFWIGEWEVSWVDENGNEVKGENSIERILNEKVIQENFKDETNNYYGKSFSVYNSKTNLWNQSYVDTNGIYYQFIGVIEEGNPVFKTQSIKRDGKNIILKMIFKDISENDFVWEWLGTRNGGIDWKTLWKIDYKRK